MLRHGHKWAHLLLLLPFGCEHRAYCFDRCDEALSQGGADTITAGGGNGIGGATSTGGASVVFGEGGREDCDADLDIDPENCGECGNVCVFPNGFPACEAGLCVIHHCVPGFFDVDSSVPGCEAQCIDVDVPTTEDCDGLDNDCDGLIDEAEGMRAAPTNLCRTTPNTPCADSTVICDSAQRTWVCQYPTGVEAVGNQVLTAETRCDGIDGDCDGEIDDEFPGVGDICADNGQGVCRDEGVVACDLATDDLADTFCDLSAAPDPQTPGPELCNGLDDDCNGVVDDGIVFDMVAVPSAASPVFFVDRYEASRLDATALDAGVEESIACSATAVMPWTAIAWEKAQAACTARGPGYRLCTGAELADACSEGTNRYPYGSLYEPETCNGWDHNGDTNELLPTGSLTDCVTAAGIFDLSGNAAEWTSTETTGTAGDSAIYQLHGGSYVGPAEGISCTIPLAPRAVAATILPTVGFRCCRAP